MSRLVFLLEERSMRVLLEALLPRLFPGLSFLCVEHEGKQDLDKSIPRKLRAWREPGVRFVIVRDQDEDDCKQLKRRLVRICSKAGRPDTLVRIACQELEAWYLGDLSALAQALDTPAIASIGDKARFRDPDQVQQPAAAITEMAPRFQKVSGARAMAPRLDPTRNNSKSFRTFVAGVRGLVGPPVIPDS